MYARIKLASLCLILAFGVSPVGAQSVIRGGGVAFPLLVPDGTASAPSIGLTSANNTGIYWTGNSLIIDFTGVKLGRIDNAFETRSTGEFSFNSGGDVTTGSVDVRLLRDAAGILALKNAANAQTFRLYGTTTGPFYASLSSDSSGGVILGDQASNYLRVGGPAPTAGTCGTSPTIIAGSTDTDGGINVGSGVTTACTINFSHTLSRAPFCTASDNSTAVTADVSAVSTTSFTVSTSASIGSGIIYWHCGGAV